MANSHRRHSTCFVVPFSDVDKAGIVYTAHFADYMLKGLEEYFRNIGIPWESYVGGPVIMGTPVVNMSIRFHSPAYCGDEIEIDTRISKIIRRRIYFKILLTNQKTDQSLVTGKIIITAFDMNYKPCEIPQFIVEAIDGKGHRH